MAATGGTSDVLAAARRYVAAGLSVVPVPPDGSKHPASAWKVYLLRLPTDPELVAWFASGRNGPAVVAGGISGRREVIDIDRATLFALYCEGVERLSPGLIGRLTVVRTPRPGYQLHYRCPDGIAGNQPLAREPKVPTDDDPAKFVTLIETRGEGGLALSPACPPACHPAGRRYALLQGDFATPATISAAERTVLLDVARTFNTYAPPGPVTTAGDARARRSLPDRPGDRFNARTDWADLLEPHGWRRLFDRAEVTVWRRPGKQTPGGSATTNFGGGDLLYVFSSNAAPFEPGCAYTKFAAHALLDFSGDFSAAARRLARPTGRARRVPEQPHPIGQRRGTSGPMDWPCGACPRSSVRPG